MVTFLKSLYSITSFSSLSYTPSLITPSLSKIALYSTPNLRKMLEIYIKGTCPFCHTVIAKAKTLMKENVDYKIIDATPGTPGREVVLKVGGKPQVPFLIDPESNVSMYESSKIIEYITQKFSK